MTKLRNKVEKREIITFAKQQTQLLNNKHQKFKLKMEMNKLIENILENDEIILKYLSISMIIFSVIAFILEMSGIYVR